MEMSAGDESDLRQRALAAAATRQAELEASQEARSREQAECRAQGERNLIDFAIRKLEEILSYQTSPADWEIIRYSVHMDYGIYDERAYARIVLLGVEIRAGGFGSLASGSDIYTLHIPEMHGPLTMENFGQALAERKRRE